MELKAKLLTKAQLIIWDEALVMNKYCFEAFDQTLRNLIGLNVKIVNSLDEIIPQMIS